MVKLASSRAHVWKCFPKLLLWTFVVSWLCFVHTLCEDKFVLPCCRIRAESLPPCFNAGTGRVLESVQTVPKRLQPAQFRRCASIVCWVYLFVSFSFSRCIAQGAAWFILRFKVPKLPPIRVFSLLLLRVLNLIVCSVSDFCTVPSLFAQIVAYISDCLRLSQICYGLQKVPERSLYCITGS